MQKINNVVEKIIKEINKCGTGWKVLLFENGNVSSVYGNGYGGEQDGNDPVCIFSTNDYEGEKIEDEDTDTRDMIQERIEEAEKGE